MERAIEWQTNCRNQPYFPIPCPPHWCYTLVTMGILTELTKLLQTTVRQLTVSGNQGGGNTSIDTSEPYFTKKFEVKAKSCGLTEADAKDVLHHGSSIRENMLVRKYNGYEIGIYYFNDAKTGRTVITSIWKRERR